MEWTGIDGYDLPKIMSKSQSLLAGVKRGSIKSADLRCCCESRQEELPHEVVKGRIAKSRSEWLSSRCRT